MFALIIPVLLPFALLGFVMALAWWEDRLLPPTVSAKVPVVIPMAPEIPSAPREAALLDAA